METPTKTPTWKRSLFKRVHGTASFFSILLRAPFWMASSIIPSWRPISRWSYRQTLGVKMLKFILASDENELGRNKRPPHLSLQLDKGVLGVYVDAVPELIHGDLQHWVDVAHVEPIRLPGYWIHKKGTSIITGEKPSKGEKVVYFLHGGGYVVFSAHPSQPTSNIPRLLLKHCDRVRRTFAIEYRLTVGPPTPAFPFPTALVDALAGYNYLVNTVGLAPEDIIVAGDSAGGNLALALTRYLVEYASQLSGTLTTHPSPGAMLLLSPWTDLSTATHSNLKSSVHTRQSTDYVPSPSPTPSPDDNTPARAFVGPHGFDTAAFTNPYISPGSPDIPEGTGSYAGFPKTMIVVGEAELLLDAVRLVKDRMERDLGAGSGMVHYVEAKDAVHDFLVFAWHKSGRKETVEEIVNWVAEL